MTSPIRRTARSIPQIRRKLHAAAGRRSQRDAPFAAIRLRYDRIHPRIRKNQPLGAPDRASLNQFRRPTSIQRSLCAIERDGERREKERDGHNLDCTFFDPSAFLRRVIELFIVFFKNRGKRFRENFSHSCVAYLSTRVFIGGGNYITWVPQ